MAGDVTAGIGEHPPSADAARLSSYDFLLEDDTDLQRRLVPGTARALDAYIDGPALLIALDPRPQCTAHTREAITRLIDPSVDQVGPREEDR
jgi:hypothetical protein